MKIIARLPSIGKPRMTRSDKWKKRACVVAYRAWCDQMRIIAKEHGATPRVLETVYAISIRAYIGFPKSYSKKRRAELAGEPHTEKPDTDNIAKAVMDCLIAEDKTIWKLHIEKRWEDKQGERIELELLLNYEKAALQSKRD